MYRGYQQQTSLTIGFQLRKMKNRDYEKDIFRIPVSYSPIAMPLWVSWYQVLITQYIKPNGISVSYIINTSQKESPHYFRGQ